jgi:hypothetical protein
MRLVSQVAGANQCKVVHFRLVRAIIFAVPVELAPRALCAQCCSTVEASS